MILTVSGYGYTRSGTILDLLKEYEGFNINDDIEMSLFCMPTGIPKSEAEIVNNTTMFGFDVAADEYLALMRRASNRYGIFRQYHTF